MYSFSFVPCFFACVFRDLLPTTSRVRNSMIPKKELQTWSVSRHRSLREQEALEVNLTLCMLSVRSHVFVLKHWNMISAVVDFVNSMLARICGGH